MCVQKGEVPNRGWRHWLEGEELHLVSWVGAGRGPSREDVSPRPKPESLFLCCNPPTLPAPRKWGGGTCKGREKKIQSGQGGSWLKIRRIPTNHNWRCGNRRFTSPDPATFLPLG